MQQLRKRFILAAVLVMLAVATRLLPHQANFTAVGAVALVAGAYFGRRWAASVTVLAMLFSDALIGFYDLPVMIAVYGSLLVTSWIGQRVGKNIWWGSVAGGSLAGALLFFLVTNWAVWQFTAMYPQTVAGLLASYAAAWPFFRNSLVSDLVWSGGLFSAAEFFRLGYWRRRPARQPSAIVPLHQQTSKP